MSNDDLKYDGAFTILCNDPLQDNSAPTISNLELFKPVILIDADRNCDDNGDYGQ